VFVEGDMARNIHTTRKKIKTMVTFVLVGIAKKGIGNRTWRKFCIVGMRKKESNMV
jgi:hypothetical protein